MESAMPEKMDVMPELQHVEQRMEWVPPPPPERIMIILVGLVGSGKAGTPQDRGYLHLTCS